MVRTQAVSRQGEGGPRSGGRDLEDEAGLTSALEMAYNEGRKKERTTMMAAMVSHFSIASLQSIS